MANATPIPVPETLVGFHLSAQPEPLVETLKQLAATISNNGVVLDKLYSDFHALKEDVSRQGSTLKKHMHQSELAHKSVLDELAGVDAHVKAVASRCAWKDEVFSDLSAINKQVQHVQLFVDEIEQGGGERVQKFIRTYMEANLPAYFASATEPLWHRTVAAVAQAKDEGITKTEIRAKEAEERAKVLVQQTRNALFDQINQANEDRKKELSKLKTATEEQLHAVGRRVKVNHDDLVSTANAFEAQTQQKLSAVTHSFETLRTALFLDSRLLNSLFQQVSSGVIATADSAKQDRKLTAVPAADVRVEHDAGDGGTEEGGDDEEEEEEEEEETTLEEAAADPRVRAIHRTPLFTVLRSMIHQEFQEKLDLVRGEVHGDVMAELFDVQKELKGKVGAAKLSEHIMRYRDNQLYANVRQLLSDVSEVRSSKVDGAYFGDALKSKADIKAMDAKADKLLLLQTAATLTARLEHLETELSRAAAKLRVQELQQNDIKITVLKQTALQQHQQQHLSTAGTRHSRGGSGVTVYVAPETTTPQTREVIEALDAANKLRGGERLPESIVIDNSLRDVPAEDELLKKHHPIGYGLKEQQASRGREYAVSQETAAVQSNAVSIANNARAEALSCTASTYRQRHDGTADDSSALVEREDPALAIVSPQRAVAVLNDVGTSHSTAIGEGEGGFPQIGSRPQTGGAPASSARGNRTPGNAAAAVPGGAALHQRASSARAPRQPQTPRKMFDKVMAKQQQQGQQHQQHPGTKQAAGAEVTTLVDGHKIIPGHDVVVQSQNVRYPHLRGHYKRQEMAAEAQGSGGESSTAPTAAARRGKDGEDYQGFTESQKAYVLALNSQEPPHQQEQERGEGEEDRRSPILAREMDGTGGVGDPVVE